MIPSYARTVAAGLKAVLENQPPTATPSVLHKMALHAVGCIEALADMVERPPSTSHDFDMMPDYGAVIEDYDRREAAGEDVSGEVRPRFPGGSDF